MLFSLGLGALVAGGAPGVHNGRMGRLLLRLLINTVALWLTTLILDHHVDVRSYGSEGDTTAYVLTLILLDVEFAIDPATLAAVDIGAIVITGVLGATTILSALRPRPALFLRTLGAE